MINPVQIIATATFAAMICIPGGWLFAALFEPMTTVAIFGRLFKLLFCCPCYMRAGVKAFREKRKEQAEERALAAVEKAAAEARQQLVDQKLRPAGAAVKTEGAVVTALHKARDTRTAALAAEIVASIISDALVVHVEDVRVEDVRVEDEGVEDVGVQDEGAVYDMYYGDSHDVASEGSPAKRRAATKVRAAVVAARVPPSLDWYADEPAAKDSLVETGKVERLRSKYGEALPALTKQANRVARRREMRAVAASQQCMPGCRAGLSVRFMPDNVRFSSAGSAGVDAGAARVVVATAHPTPIVGDAQGLVTGRIKSEPSPPVVTDEDAAKMLALSLSGEEVGRSGGGAARSLGYESSHMAARVPRPAGYSPSSNYPRVVYDYPRVVYDSSGDEGDELSTDSNVIDRLPRVVYDDGSSVDQVSPPPSPPAGASALAVTTYSSCESDPPPQLEDDAPPQVRIPDPPPQVGQCAQDW